MNLSVKRRIALTMGIVVLMNVIAGVAAFSLNRWAANQAALSQSAADRAGWAGGMSASVVTFLGQATDLAFAVTTGVSEESSAEYGDLVGADAAVTRQIEAMPPDIDAATQAEISKRWTDLRAGVFTWINDEAEAAGSPLRLSLAESGDVRSGATSNIQPPAALAGLTGASLRQAVRTQAESFTGNLLRGVVTGARADASAAEAAASGARTLQSQITIAAIVAGLALALCAAVWLYKTIAGPLGAARDVAGRIAAGDYSATFTRTGDDEIGALVHALEGMRGTVVGQLEVMREMAGAVIVTADDLATEVRSAREQWLRLGLAGGVCLECGTCDSNGGDGIARQEASGALATALDDIEQNAGLLSSFAGQMLTE